MRLVFRVQSVPRYIARLHIVKRRKKNCETHRLQEHILNAMFYWVESIRTSTSKRIIDVEYIFKLELSIWAGKLWISNINYAFASNAIPMNSNAIFDMLNDMKTSRLLHSSVLQRQTISSPFRIRMNCSSQKRKIQCHKRSESNGRLTIPLTCFLLHSYEKFQTKLPLTFIN